MDPVLPTLPPHLAAPLAELALRELTQAGFGKADTTGRTEASIIADALGAPVAVFGFADDDRRTLRVAVASGWEPPPDPVAVEGVHTRDVSDREVADAALAGLAGLVDTASADPAALRR